MIRHVVVFSFAAEVDGDRREAIASALRGLVGVVPGLVAMRTGPDLGWSDGNGDLAVTADFVDEDAWRGYGPHPAHQAVATELIFPFMTARAAVQFSYDDE